MTQTRSNETGTRGDETDARRNESDTGANDKGSSTDNKIDSLLPQSTAAEFNEQWTEIQRRFVDEPRESVRAADGLVGEVMQRVASVYGDTRAHLEQQWDSGEDVSTEDLRVALTRYRAFFQRLLTV